MNWTNVRAAHLRARGASVAPPIPLSAQILGVPRKGGTMLRYVRSGDSAKLCKSRIGRSQVPCTLLDPLMPPDHATTPSFPSRIRHGGICAHPKRPRLVPIGARRSPIGALTLSPRCDSPSEPTLSPIVIIFLMARFSLCESFSHPPHRPHAAPCVRTPHASVVVARSSLWCCAG